MQYVRRYKAAVGRSLVVGDVEIALVTRAALAVTTTPLASCIPAVRPLEGCREGWLEASAAAAVGAPGARDGGDGASGVDDD